MSAAVAGARRCHWLSCNAAANNEAGVEGEIEYVRKAVIAIIAEIHQCLSVYMH
jgi:hypothetical protein